MPLHSQRLTATSWIADLAATLQHSATEMHARTLTPPRISRRSADSREIVPRPGDHAGNTSLLDRLISKNSPKIAATSNTLIVTCATVILIAVLVFLELYIRRSLVHLLSTGAETRSYSPTELKQP